MFSKIHEEYDKGVYNIEFLKEREECSLLAVNDAFTESIDFSDVSTQIPFGGSKSFCEIVDNTYPSPLSFLEQSRWDYISANDLNRGSLLSWFELTEYLGSGTGSPSSSDIYEPSFNYF